MISFVVPAHNEEACLPQTLRAIHDSARTTGEPYEIIVVNDASTDSTPEVARAHAAKVIDVQHRQIAATRNSGARAALGERIFFVDADTTINGKAVRAAFHAMDKGAVGGGGHVRLEGPTPLYIQIWMLALYVPAKLTGFCGGAFMFCTRAAFEKSGGFDERMFWGEEGSLALALKRQGRFVVIWERVLTSGRRLRVNSGFEVASIVLRAALRPKKIFTQRSSVEKIWYNSNRAGDNRMPNDIWTRIFNGLALLITISLVTGPLWYFVPWSQTPLSTPFGKFRFANAVFLSHAGLLAWPLAGALGWNLVRQRFNAEWLKLAFLVALCGWQAWISTQSVGRIWGRFYHWFAG